MVPGTGFLQQDNDHFRIILLPEANELNWAINEIGDFLKNYAEILGGIILILVGLNGLVKKPSDKIYKKNNSSIKKSLLVGFSVGLDGAVGSFTLTASGFNGIFVALFITFIHVILLILALYLSKKLPNKIKNESKIPPLILVFLGLYKLLF